MVSKATIRIETSVRGLIIYENFLQHKQENLRVKALELSSKISRALPPPIRSHVSKLHNIKAQRSYRLFKVNDEEKTIQGQHFDNYGSKSHSLNYFTGNENVPKFVQEGLIDRILEIPEIRVLSSLSPLDWNYTMNSYEEIEEHLEEPLFDYHQDIAPNGDITMGCSIGGTAQFRIRLPGQSATMQKFTLKNDSPFILSKEARWKYEHAVFSGQPGRMSLVLGCKRIDGVSDRRFYQ